MPKERYQFEERSRQQGRSSTETAIKHRAALIIGLIKIVRLGIGPPGTTLKDVLAMATDFTGRPYPEDADNMPDLAIEQIVFAVNKQYPIKVSIPGTVRDDKS